jgi:hypothetical protein
MRIPHLELYPTCSKKHFFKQQGRLPGKFHAVSGIYRATVTAAG